MFKFLPLLLVAAVLFPSFTHADPDGDDAITTQGHCDYTCGGYYCCCVTDDYYSHSKIFAPTFECKSPYDCEYEGGYCDNVHYIGGKDSIYWAGDSLAYIPLRNLTFYKNFDYTDLVVKYVEVVGVHSSRTDDPMISFTVNTQLYPLPTSDTPYDLHTAVKLSEYPINGYTNTKKFTESLTLCGAYKDVPSGHHTIHTVARGVVPEYVQVTFGYNLDYFLRVEEYVGFSNKCPDDSTGTTTGTTTKTTSKSPTGGTSPTPRAPSGETPRADDYDDDHQEDYDEGDDVIEDDIVVEAEDESNTDVEERNLVIYGAVGGVSVNVLMAVIFYVVKRVRNRTPYQQVG